MTPFGNPADIGTLLGVDVDDARALLALNIASSAIRAALQQRVDYIANDVVQLDIEPDRRTVFLPELPVVDVSAVEQLDRLGVWVALDAGTYAWSNYGTLTRVSKFGTVLWSDEWRTHKLRVTYSHGYDPIPDDLASVAVTAAARLMENPVGIAAERIGEYQVTFDRAGGVSFNELEQATIDRYSIARVG